jgi:hypothetical protein
MTSPKSMVDFTISQCQTRFNNIRDAVPKQFNQSENGKLYYYGPNSNTTRIYLTIAHLKGLVGLEGQRLGGLLEPVPSEWLFPYIRRFLEASKIFPEEINQDMWVQYMIWENSQIKK